MGVLVLVIVVIIVFAIIYFWIANKIAGAYGDALKAECAVPVVSMSQPKQDCARDMYGIYNASEANAKHIKANKRVVELEKENGYLRALLHAIPAQARAKAQQDMLKELYSEDAVTVLPPPPQPSPSPAQHEEQAKEQETVQVAE